VTRAPQHPFGFAGKMTPGGGVRPLRRAPVKRHFSGNETISMKATRPSTPNLQASIRAWIGDSLFVAKL